MNNRRAWKEANLTPAALLDPELEARESERCRIEGCEPPCFPSTPAAPETPPDREKLAEWFFNNESEEQEADDKKHRQREQKYARWPEDAEIQPYCKWAYRRADAFIAHFRRAGTPRKEEA